MEEVSDDEFERLTEGWEKDLGKIDYSLKTAKQRKQMKKRAAEEGVEEADLDDEEIDFGELYSDQSEDEEDFDLEDELDDDFELGDSPPKPKKSKTSDEDLFASAECVGELMDEGGVETKQMKWEEGKSFKKNRQKKSSSKNSKKKKSSILTKRKK